MQTQGTAEVSLSFTYLCRVSDRYAYSGYVRSCLWTCRSGTVMGVLLACMEWLIKQDCRQEEEFWTRSVSKGVTSKRFSHVVVLLENPKCCQRIPELFEVGGRLTSGSHKTLTS